jgi:hypothetical protein
LISQCKFDDTRALINSELDTLRQRNKILKIADRHGWDTVNEYLDDPLADNNEDARKLRGAIVFDCRSLAEATKKVLWFKSARILEAWSLSFTTCPNNSSPELGGILVVVSQRIIKVLVNSVPTMAVCNFEYFVALAKRSGFKPKNFLRGFGQASTVKNQFNTPNPLNLACFYCKRLGHFAKECPFKLRAETKSSTTTALFRNRKLLL